eukprot:TRINITY_DN15674_c0_g1_i1.p2 TRINITY_DN15674_c0_g1~~TRINITY_DN15674_c0_g1_i1.p2  ORF type:complete len:161 (+),score=14.80 TRINITY_DN15674_c0_g1_i1:51-485(+)
MTEVAVAANEVWEMLTTRIDADDCVVYSVEDLLVAIRWQAEESKKPRRDGYLMQPGQPGDGIFAKLLDGETTLDTSHDKPSQGPPPTEEFYNDWAAKAESRRALFQHAKNRGVKYNTGVMLDVQMCRGPTDGLPSFPKGRGRPI